MFEFGPITPAEQMEAVRFLLHAFRLPAGASFVDPERLRWKKFDPHPLWTGARAYALRQSGRIAAYGCVYPITFVTPEREVSSMRIIDWAGSPGVPGAGVLLFRKLAAMTDTALAPGGSEQTQQIMPRIGFERRGDLDYYARVIRPLRQHRLRDGGLGWRATARLLRNSAWSLRGAARISEAWTVSPGGSSDTGHTRAIAAKRSPELMAYLARAPGAHLAAFSILHENRRCGWFALSRIGGQARIADIRMESESPEHWVAGVGLAARTAAREPEVCEVIGAASTGVLRLAFARNGFIFRRRDPVFVRDPGRLLTGDLQLSLLDGDEFFLSDTEYPFLT